MPGLKRPLEGAEAQASNSIHPARKRRVEHTKHDKKLAKCYNDLADELPSVRLQATRDLIETLSTKSPEQVQNLQGALTRLIKGLCSPRKAARPGFSIALSEVLRLAFELAYVDKTAELDLEFVTKQAIGLTQPEGKASGQEQRDYQLGRRFAFQAILQSDIGHREAVPIGHWKQLVGAICDLAKQREWLRSECGAMFWQYLESSRDTPLGAERLKALVETLREAGLLKSPEGVAIWLLMADRSPNTLPTGVWHKNDPLSSDERPILKKILLGASADEGEQRSKVKGSSHGSRQSRPSFAWQVVLSHLFRRDAKDVKRTWEEIVENSLLAKTASDERKSLGLQVISLAVAVSPSNAIHIVLGEKIVHFLLSQRASAESSLHKAAKQVLDQIEARARSDQQAAPSLLAALVKQGAFDTRTKTKTLESIVQQADDAALDALVAVLYSAVKEPNAADEKQAEHWRQSLADMLLKLVQSRREPSQLFDDDHQSKATGTKLRDWLKHLLQVFVEIGYQTLESETSTAISESSRSAFRLRLSSTLSTLMAQPLPHVLLASGYVTSALGKLGDDSCTPLSKSARETVKQGRATRKAMSKDGSQSTSSSQAYMLLFDMSILQVYSQEPDSIEALQDLQGSFQARKEGGESSTMLIELLLSFLSKQSALFRKLAEQVFSAFASELSADSMVSMLDILQQKESAAGQEELFQQHASDDEAADSDGGSEEEGDDIMDVDDMSDVELINGEEVVSSEDESEDSDSSSDAETGAEVNDGEDEEAAFDRKLADALGTAAADADSDDDGSDMDDEQMMALEPHLTNIFQERKKTATKKQENKGAKENIVNFKNRVLDLLSIYVKSQYANPLAVDLILPLTTLVRTTSSKPTAEKAFAVLKQYFDACTKHKSHPEPDDADVYFEVLAAVHAEMSLGGSLLHASACSRSSLFLSKILVIADVDNFDQIDGMYSELRSEWFKDPKSKIHKSVFNDWHNWVSNTRKQG